MCRPKIILLAVAALLVYGFAFANPGFADALEKSPDSEQPAASMRIVVMPFENMMQVHGLNRTLRGPVTRKVFTTGEVSPKAELIMDQVLLRLLEQGAGVQWRSPQADAVNQMQANLQGVALIKRLQAVGDREQAQAVLVAYLYAYREREGGAFGAERPAGVAFELALVGVESGAIIWHKGFSETQRALNENLLEIGKFIRRKGRWVTARDMGKHAIKEMLKSFPWPHGTPHHQESGNE